MTRGQAHDVTDSLDIGRRGLEPVVAPRKSDDSINPPHGREHRTIVYYGRGTPGTASILKSVTWRRTPGSLAVPFSL